MLRAAEATKLNCMSNIIMSCQWYFYYRNWTAWHTKIPTQRRTYRKKNRHILQTFNYLSTIIVYKYFISVKLNTVFCYCTSEKFIFIYFCHHFQHLNFQTIFLLVTQQFQSCDCVNIREERDFGLLIFTFSLTLSLLFPHNFRLLFEHISVIERVCCEM